MLIACVAAGLALASCTQSNNPTNITPTVVQSTLTSGGWRITYYMDSGQDETGDFSGYTFTFVGDSVRAVKGATLVRGTWGTRNDDSKTKLDLFFPAPPSFASISDDWHVMEQTSNKIRLQDISGGNGGTDYLTFEKN